MKLQMRVGLEQFGWRPIPHDQRRSMVNAAKQVAHLGRSQRHSKIGRHDRPAEIQQIGSRPGGAIDGQHDRFARLAALASRSGPL